MASKPSTWRLSKLALLLPLTFALSLPSLAQKASPSDDTLTQSLLSEPGPTFRLSASEFPKQWTLIAYGDMRFTDPANVTVTNPKVRRWLVDRIATEHPNALLLSGDVPYSGSEVNDYTVFHQETSPWREAKLHVYPAMGNHELHGDEVREPKNWWGAFPELKGRRWYSVEAGNAYILSLDSNLPLTAGSRQRVWLDDQLAHLPKSTQFIFVSLHHPPVADSIEGNHSHDVRANEHELALALEKQATQSKAQIIVIAGHIHNYQRFLQNGVIYLVSGGGGAKPYPIARTPADKFQDPAFPNYHYLKFVFDGKELQATMYRVKTPEASEATWEIKDTFTIPVKQ